MPHNANDGAPPLPGTSRCCPHLPSNPLDFTHDLTAGGRDVSQDGRASSLSG